MKKTESKKKKKKIQKNEIDNICNILKQQKQTNCKKNILSV